MKDSFSSRLCGWWRSHQQSLGQFAMATAAAGFAALALVARLGFSLWELSLFGLTVTPMALLLLIIGIRLGWRH